jgi:beta-phosphoglucomutase-like phosphatase (HAD superfamily)
VIETTFPKESTEAKKGVYMEYIGKHLAFHNAGPGSLLTDGGEKILQPHKCFVGELLSNRHYHVFIKYAYARTFLENNSNLGYWQDMYSNMQLRKGRQPDLRQYNSLIVNMKNNGFDSQFPIPIDRNYDILDGSHRLAICLALEYMPFVQMYSKMSKCYEKDRFNYYSDEDILNIDKIRDELFCKFKYPTDKGSLMTVWGTGLPVWNGILDFIGKDKIKRAFIRNFVPEEYATFIAAMYSVDGISLSSLLRKSWTLTKFEPAAGIVVINEYDDHEISHLKTIIREKFIGNINEYHYDSIIHSIENKREIQGILRKIDLYKPVGYTQSLQNISDNLDDIVLNGSRSHKEYKNIIIDKHHQNTSILDLINTRFSLAIFDLDGTIVDSEIINSQGYANILLKYGIYLSISDAVKMFAGRSKTDNEKIIRDKWGITFTKEHLSEKKLWIHESKSHMVAVDGIADLISQIKCIKAIASGSSMETINSSLIQVGLAQYFPVTNRFSSSQVLHGKPASDIFLLTADTLNIEPDKCIVIEDSPAGIKAAVAAGMHFIWYGHGQHTRLAYSNDDLKFLTKPYLVTASRD